MYVGQMPFFYVSLEETNLLMYVIMTFVLPHT
jgi:hypothetical protein